ncbi:MAG TPA: HNH/ENDO VII family nuclease [Candidatus Sulfotelmatobacter sp.]|nr:HNH/ENDO VII family nuclease [Candidatus Sulfotelmatobacter sp.]
MDESTEENGDFAARYNVAEEPLEGISRERTADAINQLFGTKQLPARMVVTRNRVLPWKTMPLRNGNIAVNAAKIPTKEETPLAIFGAGLRAIWPRPDVQRAWNYVHSNLTPTELKEANKRRKAQGLPTNFRAVQDDAAAARVINSDGRDRIVENFHNAIRGFIGQRLGVNIPPRAHPLLKEAVIQFLRERTQQGNPVADPAKARPLRNVLWFKGLEIRAVRNLSHLKVGTLRAMARDGFAGYTKNGERISLHHLAQNPNGPLVEMPRPNNRISNVIQHPFGNTPKAGLTEKQRDFHNNWREEYWRWRARRELRARQGHEP